MELNFFSATATELHLFHHIDFIVYYRASFQHYFNLFVLKIVEQKFMSTFRSRILYIFVVLDCEIMQISLWQLLNMPESNFVVSSILTSAVFLQPFDATTKPSKLTVLLLIIMTWAISLFVALIPFSKNLEFFFTTRAIIHDNLFFQSVVVSFEAAKDWAEKLITFSPELQTATRETVLRIRDAVSWSGLRSALGNVSETNVLQTDRFFG